MMRAQHFSAPNRGLTAGCSGHDRPDHYGILACLPGCMAGTPGDGAAPRRGWIDRTLRDIGLSRGEISSAVYGRPGVPQALL